MKFTLALMTLAAAVRVRDDAALADLEAAVEVACGGEDYEACMASVDEYMEALEDLSA